MTDVDGDVHEWVSFEDPHEQRTWMFDATFLRSNYQCIYGAGCQGVLENPAEELAQGCCSHGAHLVDDTDVAELTRSFVRLRPDQMQFHAEAAEGGFLVASDDRDEGTSAGESQHTSQTRLVDDACIFLNRPGFTGGVGCALHLAADALGERPLDWKPNVCWQLPLRLEHSTDDNGHVTSRLREWKRRDWGEGGADFHWWCTESVDAYVGDQAVYLDARDEIVELIGEQIYERMVTVLEMAEWVSLPHPATRHSS